MVSGFSFPPPPPPPPKPSTSTDEYPSAGRGGYAGGGRGRGRGGMRGGHGTGAGSGHTDSYSSGAYSSSRVGNQLDGSHDTSPSQPHGQKRKLDDRATGSWRGNRTQSRPHPMKHSTPKPKSAIPPAVPSFGAPLFPTDPLPAPFADSPSPSDTDDDEEAAFATHPAGPLRFEHEGEIITLSTPQDVEAWYAARRQNFPTAARAAAKAEARRARAAERARIEAETAQAMGYAPRPSARADALREQLRKKREQEQKPSAAPLGLAGYASSDEEDEDAAPEVQSAKVVQAAAPRVVAVPRPQQPCRYFAQRGRCRDGARCGFAHVGPPARDSGGRKTLFERLVEQERGAENRRAVLAVKFLGDKGLWKPKE